VFFLKSKFFNAEKLEAKVILNHRGKEEHREKKI
tara:strand:+ start:477 stop:578 length:102 start_codon:yes stop_codon:yes gene_type:complete